MSAAPPSGEQIELALGDQRAVIVEVGGGLRSYEVAGRAILDGYGPEEICSGGRGQPLIPWPNRTRDGRYEWGRRSYQLDLSEPGLANAIHGLVRWRNWTSQERSEASVVMRHVLHPSPGYPWTVELELSYELSEAGLTVTTRATNAGGGPAPFGVGFHPYLSALGADAIDGCSLALPAATRLLADERSIPTAREAVAGTAFDFRESRPIGALVLDDCFTELSRDGEGVARVMLTSGSGDSSSVLWVDSAYEFVMVFSGETLAPAARRRGLAVEPMSCAPNALQSGDGLARLEPGATFVARWGLSCS